MLGQAADQPAISCQDPSATTQRIPRRLRDVRGIDAEVRAQRGAGVAAAEAVGAERQVAPFGRHNGADALGHGAHVVRDGDDGALASTER